MHKLNHRSIFRLTSVTLWLTPDILMFITSIAAFVVLKKLTAPVVNEDIEESGGSSNLTPAPEPVTEEDEGAYSPEQYAFLKRAGRNKFHNFLVVEEIPPILE